MVEMVSGIVLARIMPDPLAIRVNVWRFGMSRLVGEMALLALCGRMRGGFRRRRSVRRNVAARGRAVRSTAFMSAAVLLRWQGRAEQSN
jgi:hypothetical protein